MPTSATFPAHVAQDFTDAWDSYVVTDLGPSLACTETDVLAELLFHLGFPMLAEVLVEAHADADEPDDDHYIGPAVEER
jgi:hypothetical protein